MTWQNFEELLKKGKKDDVDSNQIQRCGSVVIYVAGEHSARGG